MFKLNRNNQSEKSKKNDDFSLSEFVISLYAGIVFLTYVCTEIFSFFRVLSDNNIKIFWFLTSAVFAVLYRDKILIGAKNACIKTITYFTNYKFISIILCVILMTTFVAGFYGSPNSCDGLIYHIPRFLYWLEFSSVNFFPTHCERMIVHPPLYEYCLMHSYSIVGSDRMLFFVQWVSFLCCVIIAYALTGTLGGSKQSQIFSLFLVASLPIAITQSNAIKNDLFFATHILLFAYFTILSCSLKRKKYIFFSAISMCSAISTKGTAFIFIPLISLPIAYYYFLSKQNRGFIWGNFLRLALIASLGLTLSCPHILRTWMTYGTISSSGSDSLLNQDYSLKAQPANIVRMIASNIGAPINCYGRVVDASLEVLLGNELHNPKNIYLGTTQKRKFATDAAPTETKMSNPVHMILFIISIPYYLFLRKSCDLRKIIAVSCLLAFISFSLLVQWSPWVTRYHIPFLVLSACLATLMIGEDCTRPKVKNLSFLAICLAVTPIAVVCSFVNAYRPIITFRGFNVFNTPRYHQYFMYDGASSRIVQNNRRKNYELTLQHLFDRMPNELMKVGIETVQFSSDIVETRHLWNVTAKEKYGINLMVGDYNVKNQTKTCKNGNVDLKSNTPQFIIARNSKNVKSNSASEFNDDSFRIVHQNEEFLLISTQITHFNK